MSAAEKFGQYLLYEPIARGGMATVHTARLVGAEGFTRLVAAKRLHAQFAEDPEFVTMLHDEARIASKIHHPNVVPVLDVVVVDSEVILVQEYVHGVSLAALMRAAAIGDAPLPVSVVAAIVTGVLAGLHAAHEACDEVGAHLGIVHRDVSPQNVMVSVDGVPRLLDFGIAKAKNRTQHTRQGFMKGKMGYMAPEQLRMEPVTRRVDLYAAGVLLWEMLVNRRFYNRENEAAFLSNVLHGTAPTVSAALEARGAAPTGMRREEILTLEPIAARAMAMAPEDRYDGAAAMLEAILAVCPPSTSLEVSRWVRTMGTDDLERREKMLAANEESWRSNSRITAAAPTLGSGVRRGLVAPNEDAVAAIAPERDPQPVADARRSPWRFVPWVVCAALAFVVVDLVLVRWLGDARGRAEETSIASDARAMAPAPIAIPPPTAAPAPARADAVDAAQTATPARNAQGAAPPPTHAPRPAPRPSPPPPSHAPAPAGTTAAPGDPNANDCNPPFYYAGSRKVFKPSCL